MATPYVPVPMPIGSSASSFPASRNQRSSSFGSISASSHSSKGQLEDSDAGTLKQTSEPAQADSTSSVSSSPLVRTKFTEADSSVEYSTRPREREEHGPDAASLEARPSTPTILGYEVMEERAKFTVYKILVKKTREESWVVFRRYTDFARLNEKLKEMFPGFRLSLPPKRWFKDNYNADFLEDRQLGLQAFLQNLVAHKDIAHCLAVREFLCLDDPPGPFDSLEESRAFCETLEETNYRLQKELLEKQKELESLRKALGEQQVHIDALQGRLRALCSEPEESPCLSGTEGQRVQTGKSSALDLDREASDGESSAHDKSRFSLSGPETCASELEVAEVAHSAEEDGAS